MRVAFVVPVPRDADADRAAHLERTWPCVEHARALARQGAHVTLFVDGPASGEEALGDGARVRFVRLVAGRPERLVLAAARSRPDVLHLFHLRATAALLAACATRGCVVTAEYNGGPPWRRGNAVVRFATRGLDAAFFSARALAEPYVRAGLSAPVFALPQATSRRRTADRAAARTRLGYEGDALRLLVVARRTVDKGALCVVDAFRAITRTHPDARLEWASWGGDAGDVSDPRIRVSRIDDASKMADLYAASDVMLHPSHREIGGTSFMEALQSGCPVAASDIPTFRANAIEGAVELCPVDDAEAFARAALALFHRPDARTRAREGFAAHLSFDAIARRRLEVFERLRLGVK